MKIDVCFSPTFSPIYHDPESVVGVVDTVSCCLAPDSVDYVPELAVKEGILILH